MGSAASVDLEGAKSMVGVYVVCLFIFFDNEHTQRHDRFERKK